MAANFEPSPGQCIVHWLGGQFWCKGRGDRNRVRSGGLGLTMSSIQNEAELHRRKAVVG